MNCNKHTQEGEAKRVKPNQTSHKQFRIGRRRRRRRSAVESRLRQARGSSEPPPTHQMPHSSSPLPLHVD